jgi:mRNA-degrading endonuclease RelE of RelBE toxin-antitoxin system
VDSVQVAISPDFLKAFSLIPKQQQKKVREFTEKFRSNPTSPGINFEKITNSKDPKVRSVRIDQTYRAIVVTPEKGDVYLCAWVDHHDKAYEWAMDRMFEVNPKLGARVQTPWNGSKVLPQ